MKVFIIGDSISVHYGPYLEKYLTGIAEYSRKDGTVEALKNLDIPHGANGGDSQRVLEYLQARAKKQPIDTDYTLINCGLHDIKTDKKTGSKQIPIVEYKANLQKIIKVSRDSGLKVIWMRTTPADEEVHNAIQPDFFRFKADCIAYNEAADAVMAEAGVPSIDLYTFTNNLSDDVYCDHVHFHEHIREKQAAFIAGYIASIVN
ncbi:MAG: SGNH/GDSL hydrolase family protein [Kiritimatiellae bacterium]|nr:SGNH/GDSL hydrolase family protein [Kiritimatiellia bacterium]